MRKIRHKAVNAFNTIRLDVSYVATYIFKSIPYFLEKLFKVALYSFLAHEE